MTAQRSVRNALAVLLTLGSWGLVGCGDLLQEPDTGIATLVTVTVVAGNGQTGAPGAPLLQPLRARLVALDGSSTERLWVEWVVVEGHGSVQPRHSFSDAQGIAETTWILGPGSSRQRLEARFGGERAIFEANPCEVCPAGN